MLYYGCTSCARDNYHAERNHQGLDNQIIAPGEMPVCLFPGGTDDHEVLACTIGKWNIPRDAKECFDEIYDLIDWEADYFPDANGHYCGVDSQTEFASSKRQGVWGPERSGDEYLTDRIGRHAVEFVEKHKGGFREPADRAEFLRLDGRLPG
jgi:hypothetical protein